ncbi:hypothetical protein SLNSH_08510 [Alsobacter soli]|uniref:Uncharacterized protein n=1 Tax=Alsobacter soli TaxID=2109933 RepID=A0A2T1HVF4_9HYPH|nr:hypothetical protein [Alsobacter soli]PSC05608.1 hypothetical protein SLNSH_08510 [Alsobacter soli]
MPDYLLGLELLDQLAARPVSSLSDLREKYEALHALLRCLEVPEPVLNAALAIEVGMRQFISVEVAE